MGRRHIKGLRRVACREGTSWCRVGRRGTNTNAIGLIIAPQKELPPSTIATYVDGRQDTFPSSYLWLHRFAFTVQKTEENG